MHQKHISINIQKSIVTLVILMSDVGMNVYCTYIMTGLKHPFTFSLSLPPLVFYDFIYVFLFYLDVVEVGSILMLSKLTSESRNFLKLKDTVSNSLFYNFMY